MLRPLCDIFSSPTRDTVRVAAVALALTGILLCNGANALPSFARQTGMPCVRCHTAAYGPALTEYGREFKLNAYTWGDGDHPMPLALMLQGGFSRTDTPVPQPLVDHYSTNNNVSLDQVSLFYGGRVTEHLGVFAQGTYSGEKRRGTWDNTDIRYARVINFAGTDAVIGLSVNNNPSVQDLWNTTPAWAFPYITSPLVPGSAASALLQSGALAQTVLGATAYTMIHNHVYLEGGVYRGLSDRWLRNVGLSADESPHIKGAAPYWRVAYQVAKDPYYFSLGAFGLTAHLQPDPTVADQNRYTDTGFDATYQYNDGAHSALTVNASYIHENQNLTATFNAGGSDSATNHLNTFRVDATWTFNQTWNAGGGFFDTGGGYDATLYSPGELSGSANGTPNTRGYILQFDCVPFGKMGSWGSPWVNVRVGLQYTGYLKFNGGSSNYDGFGRSASQNNSLFAFLWMAF